MDFQKSSDPEEILFKIEQGKINFSQSWAESIQHSFGKDSKIIFDLMEQLQEIPNGGSWKSEIVSAKSFFIKQRKIEINAEEIVELIQELREKRTAQNIIALLEKIAKSLR